MEAVRYVQTYRLDPISTHKYSNTHTRTHINSFINAIIYHSVGVRETLFCLCTTLCANVSIWILKEFNRKVIVYLQQAMFGNNKHEVDFAKIK